LKSYASEPLGSSSGDIKEYGHYSHTKESYGSDFEYKGTYQQNETQDDEYEAPAPLTLDYFDSENVLYLYNL